MHLEVHALPTLILIHYPKSKKNWKFQVNKVLRRQQRQSLRTKTWATWSQTFSSSLDYIVPRPVKQYIQLRLDDLMRKREPVARFTSTPKPAWIQKRHTYNRTAVPNLILLLLVIANHIERVQWQAASRL